MFFSFVDELRAAGISASLKEHLVLLEALDAEVIAASPEEFYYLARATFVKDEGLLDRFDQVFGKVFKGLEADYGTGAVPIPEEWLKKVAELYLSPEEMAKIQALGSWEEIMAALKKRLEEQQGRHQGGSKWIGTAGTSPFGAYGYNPEGIRIGQEGGRNRSAIKVWDKREFRNLDNQSSSARATSRWRSAACGASPARAPPTSSTRRDDRRHGAQGLARHPHAARAAQCGEIAAPARRRRVDGPARQGLRELFSAAHSEFKNLDFFYFHNAPTRACGRTIAAASPSAPRPGTCSTNSATTEDRLRRRRSMSPYEVSHPGGRSSITTRKRGRSGCSGW
jgi:uncharacterized protein with von Willebrand factor type A (vWA) domain